MDNNTFGVVIQLLGGIRAMKLNIKIIGHTAFLIIMASLSLALLFLFLSGMNPKLWEQPFWLTWFLVIFVFTIIWLWSRMLTQLISVELTESQLMSKNMITRTERTLELSEIIGFKDGFFNGYAITLVGRNGQPLLTLHEHYYSNFRDFMQSMDLKYLGRRPNLFKRLFKRT